MSLLDTKPKRMVRFRPNVAALFLNQKGRLLICERATFRESWQFPQGGVDRGEKMIDALHREVREEIGLSPKHYEVIEERDGYRYLYPLHIRLKKLRKHGNHGQEQTYFLCRIKPKAPEINVHQKTPEFRDYKWIKPKDYNLKWLPKFKRDVYREVMRDFFNVEL